MAVRELRAGLWHWQAPHPEWAPGERWPKEVSSCAIDDGARLLFFDPLAVPDELLQLAADRRPLVVLTAPWHERDTQNLVERLGLPVYTPPPDTADDLIRKYSVTAEQAGTAAPTWSGCSARTRARRTCTRQATRFRSESRRSPEGITTTSCSGSTASEP
jgi:hypothetical protein